jgi:NAD(P)H-hydrate epimerase
VTVFCSDDSRATIVAALPEAMARRIPGVLEAERDRTALLAELAAFDSVVAGPGFGLSPPSAALAEELVEDLSRPLVGDADLLTVFAGRARAFRRRPAPTVLTPHPGEAGRLLGSSSHDVQSDRLSAVARLARETGCVALLKGAGTLVAAPEGAIRVNPTGTPLLSTAGTGDVLAGIVGALLAGGMAAEPAAWAGAYLHGLAGEILEETLGDAGLLASELADAIPLARRRVVSSEFSVLSSGRGPETEN